MANSQEGNPFSSLFSSSSVAQETVESTMKQRQYIGNTLTRIFLITGKDSLDPSPSVLPQYMVKLSQLASDEQHSGRTGELNAENFERGLAERLYLSDPSSTLLTAPHPHSSTASKRAAPLPQALLSRAHAVEPNGIKYLAYCFARALNETKYSCHDNYGLPDDVHTVRLKIIDECKEKIARMAGVLAHRDQSQTQLIGQISQDTIFTILLHQAIMNKIDIPLEFFAGVADVLCEDLDVLSEMFEGVLSKVFDMCKQVSLSSDLTHQLTALEFFSSTPSLANILTTSVYWEPTRTGAGLGKDFETLTILGCLLSPSPMPATPLKPSEYFPHDQQLTQADVDGTIASLTGQLDHYSQRLYKIFDRLLRVSPTSRRAVIAWLVDCFKSNEDRAKMASRLSPQASLLASLSSASDGFFLNLSWVLLRLCLPFTLEGGVMRTTRIASIDPTYCSAKRKIRGCSMEVLTIDLSIVDFREDSKLVPAAEESEVPRPTPIQQLNFVTHLFFLTHKCLILGMTQVIHKFQDTARAMSRLDETVQLVIRGQLSREPGTMGHRAVQQFKLLQSYILGIKAHTMHPVLLNHCLSFYSTTAQWLVQLITKSRGSRTMSSVTLESIFPLPDESPVQLQSTPECLVENMANFAMFLRQVETEFLFTSTSHVHQLITFVSIFMGSSKFIRNPHIRAKLAQLLHVMTQKSNGGHQSLLPSVSA